jgi:acetyl-CoA acyltransferase
MAGRKKAADGARRVALIDGVRTPFLRAGTDFLELSAYDLGRFAVAALMQKTGAPGAAIGTMIYGIVIPNPKMPNISREVCLGAGLPNTVACHTVSVACISANQAITNAADQIERGYVDAAVAGGCDTMSDAPILYQRKMRKKFIASQKAKGFKDYYRLFKDVRPGDLAPDIPSILEFSTGLSMGQTAERLARRLNVTRAEQDEFAARSHQLAAKAHADGLYADQIAPVAPPPKFKPVLADNGVRGDTTIEKLGKLRPAFDKAHGTVTAGNSSYLTDGASAVLLMSEEKANELGFKPKAWLRSYAYVGSDPLEELLLGPAHAIPLALQRAGLELKDIDVWEIHEAFASQVLAVMKCLESAQFAREKFGRDKAFGRIPLDKLNLWGGSLSIGHPFGATGGRLAATMASRLKREDGRFGVIAACGAGGCGGAMVLERAD